MGETIFQSHGIIGRGTCVSRAKMEVDGEEKDVVVKWSWPAKTRTPEADLVKVATDLAIASGDNWVLKHLPMILHAEQREFDADSPQLRLSQHFGIDYELRVLSLVVQEGLRPITELTTAAELSEAFHGIFKCTPVFWIIDLLPESYISRQATDGYTRKPALCIATLAAII
jgi:hypothetical protein